MGTKRVILLKGHTRAIRSLAFSPDSKLLASASDDLTVCLWDTPSQTEVFSWPCASVGPAAVTFSPDGKLLAWASLVTRVWLIDNPEEPELKSESGGEQICFAPDGKVLAQQGHEEPVSRWKVGTWDELPGGWGGSREDNDNQQFPTGCIAYHPNGKLLASSFAVLGKRGYDSVIYLWDAKSGKLRGKLHAEFAVAHPTAIAFSPDGALLAGIYGPALRVWDLATASEIAARVPSKKHFKGLAFTPDGRCLVTVSNDKTVRLWDTASWAEVGGYEWQIGNLGAVAVAPDGFRMAAGGSTGKIVIWDVE